MSSLRSQKSKNKKFVKIAFLYDVINYSYNDIQSGLRRPLTQKQFHFTVCKIFNGVTNINKIDRSYSIGRGSLVYPTSTNDASMTSAVNESQSASSASLGCVNVQFCSKFTLTNKEQCRYRHRFLWLG